MVRYRTVSGCSSRKPVFQGQEKLAFKIDGRRKRSPIWPGKVLATQRSPTSKTGRMQQKCATFCSLSARLVSDEGTFFY